MKCGSMFVLFLKTVWSMNPLDLFDSSFSFFNSAGWIIGSLNLTLNSSGEPKVPKDILGNWKVGEKL